LKTKIQKERKMKTTHFVLSLLVGLALLVTACAPQATSTTAPVATEPPATEPPATEPPAVVPVTGAAVVNLEQNDELGSFLVDEKGMTLYLFTKDTPNTTVCYEKCAVAWPPLLTEGDPVAGEGVDATMLGTTNRTDGTVQVTYNGWPLYYYEKDKAPGDVVGQNVGDVWFVVSPAGEMIKTGAAATEPPAASAGAATVALGENDTLGSFLVDDKGMTLYLFTKDTPNTTVCYDKCAVAWPPLLTTDDPVAGEGVDASLLGTTNRTDGTVQVTYNGWPLYYYEKDKAPGDVTGQDVGGVWYVVSAEGNQITTP
jgi:predicted lipoprotein with Yx(FWY)xxD motif